MCVVIALGATRCLLKLVGVSVVVLQSHLFVAAAAPLAACPRAAGPRACRGEAAGGGKAEARAGAEAAIARAPRTLRRRRRSPQYSP